MQSEEKVSWVLESADLQLGIDLIKTHTNAHTLNEPILQKLELLVEAMCEDGIPSK